MDRDKLYNELQQRYYTHVPFPIARSVIDEGVAAFMRFLQEPDHIRNHIDFKVAPGHRRGDVGFKRRDQSDHIYNDSKDFFHFHPAILTEYTDFINAQPVVKDFLTKAMPIWQLAHQKTHEILGEFEPEFPGTLEKIFNTKNVHIMLRFLRYDWSQSGKYLAKPHFDSGSFTLAIAESCAGLRIGSCPEDLQLVEHKEGNALFMFSSNHKKVIDSDKFAPGWHDVIQLDETLIGKPFARWAMVVFIEAHDVDALPREETHKWYRPAG